MASTMHWCTSDKLYDPWERAGASRRVASSDSLRTASPVTDLFAEAIAVAVTEAREHGVCDEATIAGLLEAVTPLRDGLS